VKEFAPACERNKDPILEILREIFVEPKLVMEIGSGTGQHAEYFSQHLPHIQWQPCDLRESHPSIEAHRVESGRSNFLAPLFIDLLTDQWPLEQADAVVCINTIHIVAWQGVVNLFAGAGRILPPGGLLYVYGPYRYANRPLEASNEKFDQWLQARDPVSGVRDFEHVNEVATVSGLQLEDDRPMPANNRSIWWRKV